MSLKKFTETLKSVGSAFFGVQSEANRKRDFTTGKLGYFILAGILGVIIFVASLVSIVAIILA